MKSPFGQPFGAPSSGGPMAQGNGSHSGELHPDNRGRNMANGVQYELVPAYPPFVRLANDPNIAYFPRFRTVTFGGSGAVINTNTTQTFNFTQPTIILARTAAAVKADNSALPVGRASLDTFTAQMFRAGSNQDFVDGGGGTNTGPITQVLGSAIFGTAAQPALIPGNGLFVENGSYLNIACTILLADILVHCTLWCLEEVGPGGRG